MWRYRWFRWYHVCLLNCTWIRWCIIETSSGLPRKSLAIFGNLRTFSELFGKCSGTFVWPSEQFWKSSKIFGKWSEIFGKSSKTPSSVCLYNKKNITRWLEDMNFMFSWQEQYLTRSLRPLVRYCSCHSKIKFIYYIDEIVLLGTKPLVDSIRHFIRDPSGVFSVCHLCECRIVQWHQVCLLHCT